MGRTAAPARRFAPCEFLPWVEAQLRAATRCRWPFRTIDWHARPGELLRLLRGKDEDTTRSRSGLESKFFTCVGPADCHIPAKGGKNNEASKKFSRCFGGGWAAPVHSIWSRANATWRRIWRWRISGWTWRISGWSRRRISGWSRRRVSRCSKRSLARRSDGVART
jgi:hypothetical protein